VAPSGAIRSRTRFPCNARRVSSAMTCESAPLLDAATESVDASRMLAS